MNLSPLNDEEKPAELGLTTGLLFHVAVPLIDQVMLAIGTQIPSGVLLATTASPCNTSRK